MRRGIKYNKATKRYYIDTTITLSNGKPVHFQYRPKDDEFRVYKNIDKKYHEILENKTKELEENLLKEKEVAKVKFFISQIDKVSTLFKKYLDFRKGEIKEATVYNYSYIVNNDILPVSGEELDYFFSEDCMLAIKATTMQKNVANEQKRRILFVLKELIIFSRRIKLIDSDKKDDLLMLLETKFGVESEKESKNKYTSLEDAYKVFSVEENRYYMIIYELLYFSSLRIGEFLGIKVSDIEFKKDEKEYAEIKIVRQLEKGGKVNNWLKNGDPYKKIYFYGEPVSLLKELIETNHLTNEDFLFKISRTELRRHLNEAFKKAGVEHNSLHGFGRKSINTELYKEGADPKTRAAILGQKSEKVNDLHYVANSEAIEKGKQILKRLEQGRED